MEANGLIERNRSKIDERMVTISLTKKGRELKAKASYIPNKLVDKLNCFSVQEEDAYVLKKVLDTMLDSFKDKS